MTLRDVLFMVVGGLITIWGVIGMFWFLLELARIARGEDGHGE